MSVADDDADATERDCLDSAEALERGAHELWLVQVTSRVVDSGAIAARRRGYLRAARLLREKAVRLMMHDD